MATPKTETKQTVNEAPAKFDFSKVGLPAGYDPAELMSIGGLTPIYAAKEAHEYKWPPLVGFMKGIDILPEVKKGKEVFTPHMIRVKAANPTKAIVGKSADREQVDIKAGEDVLVPISGNLSSNSKLLALATHPEEYFLVCIQVRGQKDLHNGLSPMWDFDVQVHPKGKGRAGTEFAIVAAPRAPQLMSTSDGTVYDQNGEIVPVIGSRQANASA